MNRLVKKLIALLLVIILTSANLVILGEYTIANATSNDELNKQTDSTNNRNVLFNSYFNGETHSQVFDIDSEEAKIYLKLSVKNAGYVENGTIEFLNVNFKIKDGIETDDIQSIDTENNKIVLSRVNNGSEIILELPIEILKEDNVSTDYFNKEFITKFTGTYIDGDGNEKTIEKEITNRLSWNTDSEIVINYESQKFVPYSSGETTGVMVQTKINLGVQESKLPIKSANLRITVPSYNGLLPTSVKVIATSMAATRGDVDGVDFTTDNYTYDAENGELIINVQNLDDSIAWLKNLADQYIITFIYEGNDIYEYATENGINTITNLNAEVTLYNTEELVKNAEITSVINYEQAEGQTIDFGIDTTDNVSKGYIYSNYDQEDIEDLITTEYRVTVSANIYDSEITDYINIEENTDNFIKTEEEEEEIKEVEMSATAYSKRVEIDQEVFNKILGEEGSVIVYGGATALGIIDKDSTLEDGKYILEFDNVRNLRIETSKPITEGTIEFEIIKIISGTQSLSLEEMKEVTYLREGLSGTTNIQGVAITQTADMELIEPKTTVELEVNKTDLTTVVENENVEIRAILNTSDVYYALFENPTLEITLPSIIKDLEIKSVNLVLANGLEVSKSELNTVNGQRIITVELSGKQTEYTIGAEYKGVILIINADITLDPLTPSGTDKITLEYTNSNEVATNAAGTVEQVLNIVAPTGVVAAAGIQNYSDDGEDIQSISGEAQTVEIEANSDDRIATIEGAVINNYKNNISNISILGRIPAEGNTQIDSDEELGSTFTIPLATMIQTSGVDSDQYTIYYSNNENATNDLTDESNSWSEEATTESKSYLIVFDEDYTMASGEKFEFSYDVNIPSEISMNNSAYSMYKVYYDNESSIGTMTENKVSAVLGVSTGEGAVLEAEVTSTVDTVREGQYLKLDVEVRNAGNVDATDVVVNVQSQEYITLLEYEASNGFYTVSGDVFKIEVGDIPAGETAETSYYIKIDNNVKVQWDDIDVEDSEERWEIYEEGQIYPREVTTNVTITANELTGEVKSNDCILQVEEGKLSISLSSAISETQVIAKGNTLKFTITIEETVLPEIQNVNLSFQLPDGITYTSGKVTDSLVNEGSSDGVSYNESTNTILVNVGESEEIKYVVLEVTVTEDIETAISFIAVVTADGIEEHYSNMLEFNTEKRVLDVSELTSTPRYIKEGEEVTYTVTLTNNGKSTIRSILIRDVIPDGLTYVKSYYTVDEYVSNTGTLSQGTLSMSISSIEAGKSAEITIIAKAQALPDQNDKEVINQLTIDALGIDQIQTNTITNYVEYYEEAHQNGSGTSGTTTGYKITGMAWLDENLDGKRDASEQPIAGIQVILLNKDGSTVEDIDTGEAKVTTTSSSGTYEFTNLSNGEYLVVFAYDSSNYSLTEYQKSGVDESANSDAFDINITLDGERRIAGITDTLTVNGSNVRDIDIGLYTASKFDLRLDKYINKITVTTPTSGTKSTDYNNSEVVKVEISGQSVGQSTAVVEYKIVVTNEGSVAGYVNKIVDYLPDKIEFNSELNTDWYLSDNGNIYNSSLANTIIEPGESKEVTLVVNVKITEDVLGTITNNAEIYECYNELGLQDIDSTAGNGIETEDDMGKADVIFSLNTGTVITYTAIAFIIIAIIGFGAYEIKKHVLNKKD